MTNRQQQQGHTDLWFSDELKYITAEDLRYNEFVFLLLLFVVLVVLFSLTTPIVSEDIEISGDLNRTF